MHSRASLRETLYKIKRMPDNFYEPFALTFQYQQSTSVYIQHAVTHGPTGLYTYKNCGCFLLKTLFL